ncbi:MAG TPA: YfiR family protein [Bryobacteraceae bacterium]|nr:YfiR family protein [Bryobacteraceae bacterium]
MAQRRAKIPSILLCAAILGAAIPTSQGAEESLEYQVKAAFLLNFVKFVEWPESAFADGNSSISICILGDDPFGKTLDQLIAGETVNGRKLAVERVRRIPPLKSCQVLFVNKSEQLLPALGPGVLTVGEGDHFVREGGIIGFVIDKRRVRFDINQTAAEKAELKLSSKLLSVARSVEK